MAYIYIHRRKDNKEVFYIGISKGDTEKTKNYKRAYTTHQRNKHWHRIVEKYGYEVEIIKDNITIEEAFKEEIKLIKFYGRRDINEGNLVNMTDGGESTKNISEETRKLLSEAGLRSPRGNYHWTKNKEKYSQQILQSSERMKGDKNPSKNPSVAKKISESKKGKKNYKVSEFAKKRIGEKNSFYGKKHSQEFKDYMRSLKTGIQLTKTHIDNIKKALKNRPPFNYKNKQKTCPHCGFVGGGGNMKRYHFDKCKKIK